MEESYSRVSDLVRKLISEMMPKGTSETTLFKYQSYCLRILSSRITPSTLEDESMIKSLMQRRILKLAEEENTNKHTANAMALRLQELLQKLNKTRVIKSKTAILSLVNKIAEFNHIKANTSISPIESLFQAKEAQKSNLANQSLSFNRSEQLPQKSGYADNSIISTKKLPNNQRMDIEPSTATKTFNVSANKMQSNSQERTISTKDQTAVKLIQKIAYKGNQSLDISESDLLREILFAFQGIDGNYIVFSPSENSFVVKSTVNLSPPIQKMVYQLCEAGWLFRKVTDFIQNAQYNSKGLIYESLCYTIRNELNEYYRLIAVLDNLRDTEDEQSRSSFLVEDSSKAKALTLRKLYLWFLEPFERLKWLAILCDACKGVRGCALLSVVYAYAQQGSPTIQTLISAILKQILVPFSDFLRAWIYQGELPDQHSEFFIQVNSQSSQQSEAVWNERYKLNTAMIPIFIDKKIAENIVLVGKTINFLRRCCGVHDWALSLDFIDISSAVVASFAQASKINEFKDWILKATALTSQKLLQVIFEKYNFRNHCQSIKRYILICQGDFILSLMDHLNQELGKPATSLYRHNLVSVLETAIRASNAQFHDPEFLGRLDVKLLDPSAGDQGWEIFSLDYKVDAPINTIFTPIAMKNYLRLFNFLWRIKRVEHSLSSIWVQHIKGAHMVAGMRDLKAQMHRCHLLRHEMIHFVKNLLEYIMVEVIEGSWKIFMEQLDEAKDLNDVIRYHDEFLNTVMDRALLTSKSDQLYKRVIKLFDLTFRFKYTNEILFSSAQEDYKRRKKDGYNKQIRDIMADEADTSVLSAKDIEVDNVQQAINSETVIHLKNLWKDYKEEFIGFVNLLKQDEYSNRLRFLTFRLDFNEYYSSTNPKQTNLEEFKSPYPLVHTNFPSVKKTGSKFSDTEILNKPSTDNIHPQDSSFDERYRGTKPTFKNDVSLVSNTSAKSLQRFPVARQQIYNDTEEEEDGDQSNDNINDSYKKKP